MNKIAIIIVLALGACLAPAAFAQNHGEVGVFADYFRLSPQDINNLGAGARVSFNVHPMVQLEAEMSYDFARSFNESFTLGGTGTGAGTSGVSRTNIRILHGLFGPKFQTGGQWIRAFGTLKGGFVNFRLDNRPATFGTFTSSVQGLRDDNVNGVFYPGGGVEIYAGPIGIRAEVGDMMYFHDGAHNNLRATFGPSIRF
ncbi:MAG TPA: hypothetical protein VK699_02485 [Terriglobales bacterium]|nr:hypothetical protein [Terriglobales bacterium]